MQADVSEDRNTFVETWRFILKTRGTAGFYEGVTFSASQSLVEHRPIPALLEY